LPLTPLHYPLAYALKQADRRLSLPALTVGAVIPDIECPILILLFPYLPNHLFLHSLVGALTLGTGLAVLITRVVYSPVMSRVFGLDRNTLDAACEITPVMVGSCAIGVLSHLAIDYTMHPYNPLLWPWIDPFALPGPLVILFGNGNIDTGLVLAEAIVNGLMVFFWLVVILANRRNLWSSLWVG